MASIADAAAPEQTKYTNIANKPHQLISNLILRDLNIICSWKAITQRRLRRASCVTGKAPIHTKTNQLMHKEHSFQFRANMNKTNNNNNYENTRIIYTHEISCLSGASFEPLQTTYTFNMHFEHTKYYNSFCACFLRIFIGGKCRITCA